MKANALLRNVSRKLHQNHHDAGRVKWSRLGETFTDTAYEVTEREIKFHDRLQAQSSLERFTS
ncbi:MULTISPECIES: hypothetical protein [Deinococcus]|uniref:Uncharacterized protein n=1 Tax=Deinococcus cavernae TaxID=2320857 RepID=A0A418VAR1_9DEIO|nr:MULTISPECIES: hypothetical protein [Deinococcus]RJF73126.1 hypothetical protein D3875_17810 [Deinococcus cavernae]